MEQKQTIKQIFQELPTKEKVLLITQTIISILVMAFAIIAFNTNNLSNLFTGLAVFLLIQLMIVNALRALPTSKVRAVFYFIITGIISVFFFMALFRLPG